MFKPEFYFTLTISPKSSGWFSLLLIVRMIRHIEVSLTKCLDMYYL